jgi:hypothetical protein
VTPSKWCFLSLSIRQKIKEGKYKKQENVTQKNEEEARLTKIL